MKTAAVCRCWCLLLALFSLGVVEPASAQAVRSIPLTPKTLTLRHVRAEAVRYRGKEALRVTDAGPADLGDADRLALVPGAEFQDGFIELELAGDTAPDAAPDLRGFVGIAFRVAGDGPSFECLYLRPKNGRSPDQLQRNHSVQYVSIPGYPWQKLRSETPGKYESYVDLVPGEWVKVKIEVRGRTARLFVNGSTQPTLIVNDLKQPVAAGGIALWVGPGTIAHFAGLKLTPAVP
jgi:hypothetical protein